jgi:carbamoylphosphate synthase large subunit
MNYNVLPHKKYNVKMIGIDFSLITQSKPKPPFEHLTPEAKKNNPPATLF